VLQRVREHVRFALDLPLILLPFLVVRTKALPSRGPSTVICESAKTRCEQTNSGGKISTTPTPTSKYVPFLCRFLILLLPFLPFPSCFPSRCRCCCCCCCRWCGPACACASLEAWPDVFVGKGAVTCRARHDQLDVIITLVLVLLFLFLLLVGALLVFFFFVILLLFYRGDDDGCGWFASTWV
jgi:hypothetical protein